MASGSSGKEKSPPDSGIGGLFVINLTEMLLSDRNKTDLLHNFLPRVACGKIDKILGHPGWLAIGVIECRPCVGISFSQHAFLRGQRTFDRNHLVAFALQRDRLYVGVTLVVLAVLAYSLLGGPQR